MKTIDLFCGAGGMTKGFEYSGFEVRAAIDNDEDSVETFRMNHQKCELVAKQNLTKYKPEYLEKDLGSKDVDIIIGGPPCQGFSTASMNPNARANYGKSKKYDPRNSLYKRFFDFVKYFNPSVFVMENVPGLRFKNNGLYIKKTIKIANTLGYHIDTWTLLAADYGVPQKRKRIFLVGNHNESEIKPPVPTHYPHNALPDPKYCSVAEAILDLPILGPGDGYDSMPYDSNQIADFEKNSDVSHDYARWARNGAKILRHHVSRRHSGRDLDIFKLLEPGRSSAQLPPELQKMIPYNMTSFKNKYRRQSYHYPSTTVTAHLAKDGLYYIHPTQLRSLTPREAARLQSFQDTYVFQGTKSSIYRQIGNAVPPLLAQAISKRILKHLE